MQILTSLWSTVFVKFFVLNISGIENITVGRPCGTFSILLGRILWEFQIALTASKSL